MVQAILVFGVALATRGSTGGMSGLASVEFWETVLAGGCDSACRSDLPVRAS